MRPLPDARPLSELIFVLARRYAAIAQGMAKEPRKFSPQTIQTYEREAGWLRDAARLLAEIGK